MTSHLTTLVNQPPLVSSTFLYIFFSTSLPGVLDPQELLQQIGSLHIQYPTLSAMEDSNFVATASSAGDQDSKTCPRGHWRPAEDEKLRQLVEQYGAQNWNSIAEKLQGRSGNSLVELD